MKRLLTVLALALGLTLPLAADTQVVCTITPASTTVCSAITLSDAASRLTCTCSLSNGVSDSTLLTGLEHAWFELEDLVGTSDLTNNGGVTFAADGPSGITAGTYVAASVQNLTSATVLDLESDWALVFWAKNADTAAIRGAFSADGNNIWVYTNVAATRMHADVWGSGINGPGGITLTDWHLYTVEWDGAQVTIYTDGDNAGTPVAETAIAPSAGFAFGKLGGLFPYNGQIAAPLFYSRVITANERTCLFNAGAGAFYPFTGVCLP